jgi:hypothetical protein
VCRHWGDWWYEAFFKTVVWFVIDFFRISMATSSPEINAKEGQCTDGDKGGKCCADDYTRGYDSRR